LRSLVSALAGAGRMDEAAVEFEGLMAAFPDLTVTKFRKAMVFSAATLDRMCANLERVGLPE
jgi:adenylate cyclase